ncbi:MAG: ABC transporter permease [Proteobacteria bacterium]|nr:MAG: ABC transporter permease [Pseudomonadota bacterium]
MVAAGPPMTLRAGGAWTVSHVEALEQLFERIRPDLAEPAHLRIDLSAVSAIDTTGAWLLEKIRRARAGAGGDAREPELVGLAPSMADLVRDVQTLNRRTPAAEPRQNFILRQLDRLGVATLALKDEAAVFLAMLGAFAAALFRVLRRPASFRMTSTVYQLSRVGWQAIPIMMLITFLIGAIIAQQGIFHFRRFGADAYVVDMVGILVLREIGVLIVAIMVAGRSGSAYTAEIGSMKMREEIDALSTMGLDPVEVLIVPRVVALIIALPILAFLGAIAALYGGGLVAWLYGGMSPAIFIARLHEAVSVTHFQVGIIKAPFMALVIGLIAAAEGLRVRGSAESLGRQTTSSVVKSIFLVIVLDGVFAIFFASIGM